ncbi:hypothetical protein MXB_1547 [Myxobolus squamalis]|nr:hypothetical protein MXB_1547 [Myxobolus squamalis]
MGLDIISATFRDNSGVSFFVALEKISKINDGIARFKAYLILHLVLTEGSFYVCQFLIIFQENLVNYTCQSLRTMKNIKRISIFLTPCSLNYAIYISNCSQLKQNFLKKYAYF